MVKKSELGRIEKTSISELEGKSKKLIEIPLFFYRESLNLTLHEEYDNKINQFYDTLSEWIQQLKEKIGNIQKIYVESITEMGEAAIAQLKKLSEKNKRLIQIIEEFLGSGAQLQKTEDKDLLFEYLEWVKTANSPNALDITLEYLLQTKKERTEFLIKRIEETLFDQEIGLLFITFDLEPIINYPNDIEVIKFRPPMVDDIIKFLG
jgi:hypothetical protein